MNLIKQRNGRKRFYHFTRPIHLPSIIHRGIDRGEVAITPLHVINFPWLTTNPDPEIIREILEPLNQGNNALPNDTSKVGVRLEIELNDYNPSLITWQATAKILRIRKWFYQQLTQLPQWGTEWIVYHGVIPFETVTAAYFPATGESITPEEVRLRYGAGNQDIEVKHPFAVWVSGREALSMSQHDFDMGEDRALFDVLQHYQFLPQSIQELREYALKVKDPFFCRQRSVGERSGYLN